VCYVSFEFCAWGCILDSVFVYGLWGMGEVGLGDAFAGLGSGVVVN